MSAKVSPKGGGTLNTSVSILHLVPEMLGSDGVLFKFFILSFVERTSVVRRNSSEVSENEEGTRRGMERVGEG